MAGLVDCSKRLNQLQQLVQSVVVGEQPVAVFARCGHTHTKVTSKSCLSCNTTNLVCKDLNNEIKTCESYQPITDNINIGEKHSVCSPSFTLDKPKHFSPGGKHKTPRRIGILSASFNPPTLAHLQLCKESHKLFLFDELVFVLAKTNVDKAVTGATLPERLHMLESIIDAEELEMKNIPMSIAVTSHGRFTDKAEALKAHYDDQNPHFYFIMGYDTLIRLFEPSYYSNIDLELRPLFDVGEVIAFNRADHDADDMKKAVEGGIVDKFRSKIHLAYIYNPIVNLTSSSEARRRVKTNMSNEILLARSTRNYINNRKLYIS